MSEHKGLQTNDWLLIWYLHLLFDVVVTPSRISAPFFYDQKKILDCQRVPSFAPEILTFAPEDVFSLETETSKLHLHREVQSFKQRSLTTNCFWNPQAPASPLGSDVELWAVEVSHHQHCSKYNGSSLGHHLDTCFLSPGKKGVYYWAVCFIVWLPCSPQ